MAFAIPVKPSSFLTYYPLVTSAIVGRPPKTKFAVSLKDPAGSLQGELNNWASELKNENPQLRSDIRAIRAMLYEVK